MALTSAAWRVTAEEPPPVHRNKCCTLLNCKNMTEANMLLDSFNTTTNIITLSNRFSIKLEMAYHLQVQGHKEAIFNGSLQKGCNCLIYSLMLHIGNA